MSLSILLLVLGVIADDHFVTPFGTLLGENDGVIGYSNGNSDHISNETSTIGSRSYQIYSGMKWQCVEYARRWIISRRLLTFGSVDCASDIWHLNSVSSIKANDFNKALPLNRVPNGSTCRPKIGNLLIYKRTEVEAPYGHIAIITMVEENQVLVSEQNWSNDYWPGDYARKVPLRVDDGVYTLTDEDDMPILGWMVYGYHNSTCFDVECETCSKPTTDPNDNCSYY